MSNTITFTLDGKEVDAQSNETIWQISNRQGTEIPHLCYRNATDYRGDGNCRACVVEVEGEKALSASCIRRPESGMVVHTASNRAQKSRNMVMELLLADQSDPEGEFKRWLMEMNIRESRLPGRNVIEKDQSHPAISVNLNKCIHCQLCIQACREIQGNDVIGMAGRGASSTIVFDIRDPMGESTCVACGECVQVCPTNALLPTSVLQNNGHLDADKKVDSVCPYCGVGCQVELYVKDNKIIKVEGKDGPANHARLCVKGRFGMDYVSHNHRLTVPLIRIEGIKKPQKSM